MLQRKAIPDNLTRNSSGVSIAPGAQQSDVESMKSSNSNFWEGKFILIVLVFSILIIVAMLLEYVAYPTLMASQYGITNLSVHLSLLTFSIDGSSCINHLPCIPTGGVQSFDFAQLFIIVLILIFVYRILKTTR